MATLRDLTVAQLRQAVSIKEKIETLEAELSRLTEGGMEGGGVKAIVRRITAPKKRRKMSAAGRARIAAAAKARWAKARAAGNNKL